MSQGSHQPQSQRFVAIHLQVDGNSDSGVLDAEETGAVGTAAQRQLDIAAGASGEAVLEGIRNQFIQDQGAGDGQIRAHDDGFEIAFQADRETGVPVGRKYVGGERLRVFRKIDAREVLGSVQALVHEGHRVYTVFHVTKDLDSFLVVRVGGLKMEKAADYLEVILDAMMNFPKKSILSFFAGAQLSGHLFGDFRLLNQPKDPRDRERENDGGGERYSCREKLDCSREDVYRNPNGHHFHEVGAAAGNNEKPERQKHPGEGNVAPGLVNQVAQRH